MITQERLKELFEYKDGRLDRRGRRAKGGRHKPIGTWDNRGYLRVAIDKKRYSVHRLIFLYHHGYIPEFLDHINRDRGDNRIENLRECTQQQNMANSSISKRNTTGYRGVFYSKDVGKHASRINHGGRVRLIGYFDTPQEAAHWYNVVARIHYGEFAYQNVI